MNTEITIKFRIKQSTTGENVYSPEQIKTMLERGQLVIQPSSVKGMIFIHDLKGKIVLVVDDLQNNITINES